MATIAAVGDPIEVEVLNRADPRFGEKLQAVVTRHAFPVAGVVEVWWEVPDEVDYLGNKYYGAFGFRREVGA